MKAWKHRWAVGAAVATLAVAAPGAPGAEAPEVRLLRERARPLQTPADLDPLLARIGEARLVLLGEASHGTSEFYAWRAALTRRLVEEHGFRFIVVEGDWASLFRLNRYVKGMASPHATARAVMEGFDRWPVWMWANEETRELAEWLRTHNAGRPFGERVGIYGMDVYGEDQSLALLMEQVSAFDERLAKEVAEAYACLTPYGGRLSEYARAVALGAASCAPAMERAYERLRAAADGFDGMQGYEFFALKLNAKVLRNAERHYRWMAEPGPRSWNARVDHFKAVTDRLLRYHGEGARGVVWAHNTHVGDARATTMAAAGQRNIGQLARERYGAAAVVSVGFGTHRGTVMAGRAWGAPQTRMRVPPARPGSLEDLMHRTGRTAALFLFNVEEDWAPLMRPLPHRAIGVVYRPEQEQGNYVPTILPTRYDAFLFFDETQALRPIP